MTLFARLDFPAWENGIYYTPVSKKNETKSRWRGEPARPHARPAGATDFFEADRGPVGLVGAVRA
jgi:hypothetical protein